jgi:hypothetical protein
VPHESVTAFERCLKLAIQSMPTFFVKTVFYFSPAEYSESAEKKAKNKRKWAV